jgi:superfamily I DNA/RNA helicase
VWHNIPVGPFGRHPDFVTLHPQQGIVVLEVKDWRLDTIVNANSKQVEMKKTEDIENDIRLTYVAITRTTHEAFITYSNMSELVGRLVV